MKRLQCNFTTHEQSKRLLELGVPADSADCVYDAQGRVYIKPHEYIFKDCPTLLPCWSVGRLIEIMKICSNGVTTWYLRSTDKEPLIEQWIDFLESGLFENDFIDFSKLNEYGMDSNK